MRWAAVPLLLVAGCVDAPVEVLGQSAPTYWGDVAPMLTTSCTCCHQPGGVAPSLASPEELALHFDDAMTTIADGSMPPLPPGPLTEGCAVRPEAPRLRARDVALLERWDRGGRRPGDPMLAPELPVSCRPSPSDEASIPVTLPEYDLGTDRLVTVCYRLDVEPPSDRLITGLRIHRAPQTLRSLVLYVPDALDVGTATGAPCPDFSPFSTTILAATWGGETELRYGTGGVPLPTDEPLAVRVVYDIVFAEGDVRPLPVELDIDHRPRGSGAALEMRVVSVPTTTILEAGGVRERETSAFFPRAVNVTGALLLMHELGRRAEIELIGDTTCRVTADPFEVGRVEPVFFDPPHSRVEDYVLRCTWDLSGETEDVLFGNPPGREACLAGLFVEAP